MGKSLSNLPKHIIAFSPLLMVIVHKMTNHFGIELCLYKRLLNKECLGCGISSAIVEVLKGNLENAYSQNPLVVIVFPILLFIWLKYIVKTYLLNK